MQINPGELPADIYERVIELSKQGNAFLDDHRPTEAIVVWSEALELLPPPKDQWEAGMWLHTSLAEAYRDLKNDEAAIDHFQAAVNSGGADNAFVWMNFGMALYDLGRTKEATDPLRRAYMLDGEELFKEYGGPYLGYLRQNGLIDRMSSFSR